MRHIFEVKVVRVWMIEAADSKVKVAVIPTNEEIIIARDVMKVTQQ